jgi:hypothetical protein
MESWKLFRIMFIQLYHIYSTSLRLARYKKWIDNDELQKEEQNDKSVRTMDTIATFTPEPLRELHTCNKHFTYVTLKNLISFSLVCTCISPGSNTLTCWSIKWVVYASACVFDYAHYVIYYMRANTQVNQRLQ